MTTRLLCATFAIFFQPRAIRCLLTLLLIVTATTSLICAADWPQTRYNASHTGASPEELAPTLHLQWQRQLAPTRPAWRDQSKMTFDWAYDPIVVGERLIIGSPNDDSVTAYHVNSGEKDWQFFADGPVRLAPAADGGKLFFVSDDGFLYCLDLESGKLRWQFRGGPADQKVLGNERLISTWPARGGPVVADGTVYFAASIWPFMGIFVHALDANTGKVLWTNDGDGSLYMKQPHSTDSFASVAPQGTFAVAGDTLLVPGGRSVPACFDRRSGKLLRYLLNDNSKKGGGTDVAALGQFFVNGEAAFDVATERHLGALGRQPILTNDFAYALRKEECVVFQMVPSIINPAPAPPKSDNLAPYKKPVTPKTALPELATLKLPAAETMIKAGSKLYVGGAGTLASITFTGLNEAANSSAQKEKDSKPKATGQITWQTQIDGTVVRLAAASERLFAVTREGSLLCFGKAARKATSHALSSADKKSPIANEIAKQARDLVKRVGIRDGYAIVVGKDAALLAEAIADETKLHLIAVEVDARHVNEARQRLAAAGKYGDRIMVLGGREQLANFPPYLASLVVAIDDEDVAAVPSRLLRPFDGCLHAAKSPRASKQIQALAQELTGSRQQTSDDYLLLKRSSEIPGSANWTHEHADPANSRFSRDQVVKAPLGLLWFGGPTNEAILPRHGHGPQPQVVDGRLIIEGMDILRALDIYTGRLLWEASLPGVGKFYNNLAHQPGANATGGNFVSLSDGIYVTLDHRCLRLDPATGKQLGEFQLPPIAEKKEAPRWGYLNANEEFLIGGADPILDAAAASAVIEAGKSLGDDDKKVDPLLKLRWKALMFNDNLSASRHLIVMDRTSGKVRWKVAAEYSFRHNATCIGGDRLYTIDRPTSSQLDSLRRSNKDVKNIKPKLIAFDLKTGKKLWSTTSDVFGTWLCYSSKHDVIVESGRNTRDALLDEPKGMRAYRGNTGEVLWTNMNYVGPAIIHGDKVLRDTKAADLLTGAPTMRPDPLTGQLTEWSWTRNYGCNTPAASEHLLTFRSGAAGFLDMCNDGGTGNFGGFRSSCTNNLIVAGGVLTAADFTRTCTCSYQNQTSVGLVPVAGQEMWTMFGTGSIKGPIQHVGLNLGAPGDRRAADGLLWLETPSVGGPSPAVNVTLLPEKDLKWFRRHESQVQGNLNWVAASGVSGLRSLEVQLGRTNPQKYQVRLVFSEPESRSVGDRVFNVKINGVQVLKQFDVFAEAGAALRSVVKEFNNIEAEETLRIELTPASSGSLEPILSGVEIRTAPSANSSP